MHSANFSPPNHQDDCSSEEQPLRHLPENVPDFSHCGRHGKRVGNYLSYLPISDKPWTNVSATRNIEGVWVIHPVISIASFHLPFCFLHSMLHPNLCLLSPSVLNRIFSKFIQANYPRNTLSVPWTKLKPFFHWELESPLAFSSALSPGSPGQVCLHHRSRLHLPYLLTKTSSTVPTV